ncbi:MAG: hypothetical protein ACYTGN_11160 [Planctomycetota bacterium]|jgi:hypothetical protein
MPFEPLDPTLRKLLDPPHEAFRSVLSVTVEQARGSLLAQRADKDQEAAELGRFGNDRIDSGRFAALLSRRRTLDAATLQRMSDASDLLGEISREAADVFRAQVEPGGSLRDTVDAALARIGRSFGAARVFELAESGRFREEDHAPWLAAFPFAHWNKAERAVAPPLVVTVNGRDLRAEGLAEFADGTLKVLLLVRGEAPAAPLVRLLSPKLYVQQADKADDLAGFASYAGPGVAALAPGQLACFSHDPARGDRVWERLELAGRPATTPRRLGGRSAAQQREELAQLAALVERPAAPAPAPEPVPAPGTDTVSAPAPVAAVPAEPADAVDKLASWLLQQADLDKVDA